MINISNSSPIIGIYKITSPTNRIYIGQSTNIETRKSKYKGNYQKKQHKIYNSIKRYGWKNHKFDIIEECSIEQLDERETFWKKYYLEQHNNNWSKMLFCELYDRGGGPKSEETKRKIGESNKGKTKGRPQSKEHTLKLGESRKGRKEKPESTYLRVQKLLGRKQTQEEKDKRAKVISKPINQYDLEGNFIRDWDSITEASNNLGIKIRSISACLREKQNQTKNFQFKYK